MTDGVDQASGSHISPQYSITLRVDYPHKAGQIAKIAAAIGDQGGSFGPRSTRVARRIPKGIDIYR